MTIFIFILIVLLVAAGFFVSSLIKFRNKGVQYQESLSVAKSTVRITKAKYLQVMDKGKNMHHSAADATAKTMGRATVIMGGGEPIYGISLAEVEHLASEYQKAQSKLNAIVSEWNRFISVFPNAVYAAILKYKKEVYIDSENLDRSTVLDESIDSQGI